MTESDPGSRNWSGGCRASEHPRPGTDCSCSRSWPVISTRRSRSASRTSPRPPACRGATSSRLRARCAKASLIAGPPGACRRLQARASRRRASRSGRSWKSRRARCGSWIASTSRRSCEKSNKCTSRAMWVNLTGELRGVLDRYTLDDLAQRPCAGCRATAARAKGLRTTVKAARRAAAAPRSGGSYMRSLE
ncbi:MAG: hypothetical protein MZV70_15785 [Desulfobacterales bacterium]|nr:hypothetical protein [Desulfobacterales bacterium]